MSPRPASHRLLHVDTLRAVAALLVAWAHLSERFRPYAKASTGPEVQSWPRYFDFGITGVVLFFAISGFVIYGTLRGPREGTGQRFVITRFFRLFPAYWASLVAGLIFIWWWQGWTITPSLVIGNSTMLASLFGQPHVMGLYWTLETEIAFYLGCWLVWRLGFLDNPKVLAGLVIALTLAWFGVKGAMQWGAIPEDLSAAWKNLPRHLGIMFWGAYFRIVYDETEGFAAASRQNRKIWVLVGLTLLIVLAGGTRQYRFFIHPSQHWFSPYVVGPIAFWIWIGWLRIRFSLLAWLGKISYSIYLFHLAVGTPLMCWLALEGNARWRGAPLVVYLVPTLALTVLVAAVVFYAVERPAIALGKRLGGGGGAVGAQAAP